MGANAVYNTRIDSERVLPAPREIWSRLPLSDDLSAQIYAHRRAIERILDREDARLFVVVGPCSIHDTAAALEYAQRLAVLAERVSDTMVLVMRVYFEKPRTVKGWKGLINDPDLDDSFHVEKGLMCARELLLRVARLGLPAATEALDPFTPQYLGDLISWTAIGARTTESQTHREMASGLSTPVAFKNGTDGNVEVAINAIRFSSGSHRILSTNAEGQCSIFHTTGNPYAHVMLRGGRKPNFDAASIAECEESLREAKLPVNITVDCSHGNSFKQQELQPEAFRDCVRQIVDGNESIVGLMLESHLVAGNQPLAKDLSKLKYGVSITDACMGWEATEALILEAHEKLGPALRRRHTKPAAKKESL